MASTFYSLRLRVLSGIGFCLVAALIPACRRKAPPVTPTASPAPAVTPAAAPVAAAPAAGVQPEASPGIPPLPPNPGQPPGPTLPARVATLPPLDQLLSPIALYPDPLIALILPSATLPPEIEMAAQFVTNHGDPSLIAVQPWTESVKGLAHYPEVLLWMNNNMPWTQQLGSAFASDPAQVMNAIQDLRARAQAAGTLQSGPQEQVVTDDGSIEIEPVQPDVIYVPSYDPDLVYFGPPPGYAGPYYYWGDPYPMGIWLTYDFNWRARAVWRGDWYNYRREHGGWGRPVVFAEVRFSNAGRPAPWNASANAARWSGAPPHDFVRAAPFRDRPFGAQPRANFEREGPRQEERGDRDRGRR